MKRREFLELFAKGAVGAAAVRLVAKDSSATYAAGATEPDGVGIDTTPNHEALRGGETPWFAPFLAATETEHLQHVDALPIVDQGEKWNHLVNAQVGLIPTNDPKDRYKELTEAVRAWSQARFSQPHMTPTHQHFFYPMAIETADLNELRAGGYKQFWADGNLVNVDALQLGSYSVAVNIVSTGVDQYGDTVSMYTNPGEGAGILRARLLPDVSQGEFAVAFAPNINVDTHSSPGYARAVIFRGIPGFPVRITYSIPVPGTNGLEVRTHIEDRVLDNVGGTVTVHLPTDERLYDGNISPSVTIRSMLVSADQGEPEAMFFIGSNDVEGDPRNAGKNLITQSEVLPQLLALVEQQ